MHDISGCLSIQAILENAPLSLADNEWNLISHIVTPFTYPFSFFKLVLHKWFSKVNRK